MAGKVVFWWGKPTQSAFSDQCEQEIKACESELSFFKSALIDARASIRQLVRQAEAVGSITGIPDAVGSCLSVADLGFHFKFNVGAGKEFGADFDSMVVNDDQPINFSLESPTAPEYFEAITTINNETVKFACQQFDSGTHPSTVGLTKVPLELDFRVLKEWMFFHGHRESVNVFDTIPTCQQQLKTAPF